jgi:hypothetical protein
MLSRGMAKTASAIGAKITMTERRGFFFMHTSFPDGRFKIEKLSGVVDQILRQASRAESAKGEDAFKDICAIPGKRAMAKINKLLVGCKGFV